MVAAPCSLWIACAPVRKRIVAGRSTRSLGVMQRVAIIVGALAVSSTCALATTQRTCGPWLEGRVIDRVGSPIAGASLTGEGDLSNADRDKLSTNADGSYRFFDIVRTNCPSPVVLTVTVSAKGYEPRSETRQRSGDGWFRFEHVLDRAAE
jgi:hypothetical protein